MLFNSYFFIFLFLPVVLCLWWSERIQLRWRLVALVSASYLFYGWWDFRFVSLLLFSSLVDYFAGQKLFHSHGTTAKRFWLCVSMTSNLGLLAFFKYSGFLAESMNAVADWLRVGGALPVPELILPVGISFYTFQTMSYTIDLYRGQSRPASSFLHFAAYVSLFPQLIAGPIVRYGFLEEQLRTIPTKVDWDQFARGIFFFVAGLAQKILLADTIASRINPLLADYGSLQFVGSWYAMLGYTGQLYFDFSGYSNMAVGLGLMLGFSFPQNFDSPYKSPNISQFWRRWHMSLSSFLRDYLFIPMGGSRYGKWLTARNLMLVMVLGGLWHGAGWTFVLWGIYHGCLLMLHSLLGSKITMPRLAAVGLTFIAVVFGWVLFRSTDLQMASYLWASMLGMHGFEGQLFESCGGLKGLVVLASLLAIIFLCPNVWQLRLRPSLPSAVVVASVFILCVLRFDSESPFLYFQF